MKHYIYFIIFLLLPLVSADISLVGEIEPLYNLGDKIAVSFEILEDKDVYGVSKVSLACEDYDIDFFTNVVDIKENTKYDLKIPDLKIAKSMVGECNIKVLIESFDKEVINEFESDQFIITDELNLAISLDKTNYFPGESLVISINGLSNYDLNNANTSIYFDDKIASSELKEKINLELSKDIRSGSHNIRIFIDDGSGNIFDQYLLLEVEQMPISLRNNMPKTSYNPLEIFEPIIILTDQAGNSIEDKDVNVKIINKKDKELFSGSVKSSNAVLFIFPQFTEPGEYYIISSFEELEAKDMIEIREVEDIEVSFEGNFAYVRNIGNVKYSKKINIKLEEDFSHLILTKKISLKPDETEVIDLSKEVPQGDYLVSPVYDEEEVSEPVKPVPVSLEDNRNIIKKATQDINSITGAVIGGGTGSWIIAIIFIVLILGAFSYLSIKKIKSKKQKLKPYFNKE